MAILTLAIVALSLACFIHAGHLLYNGHTETLVARYWGAWPVLVSFGLYLSLRLYPALTPPAWLAAFICFGGPLMGGWILSSLKHRGQREQRMYVGRQ